MNSPTSKKKGRETAKVTSSHEHR